MGKTLDQLQSRLTLKVRKARLSDDDLIAIIKRINSSRSIQWWKDDIKQLLYEVKCLKDENEAIAALQADNARLWARIGEAYQKFGRGHHPYAAGAVDALDYVSGGKENEARRELGEE